MCLEEIGPNVQNLLVILGSIVNIIVWGGGKIYDHYVRERIFTLLKKKIFIQGLQSLGNWMFHIK